MKVNGNRRKIFDAVDLLMDEMTSETNGDGIQLLPVDEIKPFPDHPFHLYEGERLQDMVESVREHGVLNPVIVRKIPEGYEMLSGHNRMNAAKIAGLKEIPTIVKEELPDEEAYVYVIETNVMQRSFTDLAVSEKAAVLAEHYDKTCCQGKRNDIIRELEMLSGIQTEETCGHNGHKLKSRDAVALEYGLSSRNVARYLRINSLIQPFKDLIDENKLALLAAVDLSYLTEKEQTIVWVMMNRKKFKMKPKMAVELRKQSGELTEQVVEAILETLNMKRQSGNFGVSLVISHTICEKYFDGLSAEQMTVVVERALAAWFKGDGGNEK